MKKKREYCKDCKKIRYKCICECAQCTANDPHEMCVYAPQKSNEVPK